MFFRDRRACAGLATVVATASLVILGSSLCGAQQLPSKEQDDGPAQRISRFRPLPGEPAASQHPLQTVIAYARREQNYLRQTVSDFTCRLIKRERIGGFLQDFHYVDMQVREEILADGRVVQPLSIYLRFLGPKTVAGRKVLYVDGQNEGEMLVRNGGRHFEYVVAQIDPNGENAREESLVPVTQIGFTRLLGKMIDVLERHQIADPTGQNSKAERIAGAKINQRSCTLIRVTHPREMEGLEFHVANVFVDDQLHVPIRVDYSDWPKDARGPVPLIAEYTYTQLKINVNLPDATFSSGRLRSTRD